MCRPVPGGKKTTIKNRERERVKNAFFTYGIIWQHVFKCNDRIRILQLEVSGLFTLHDRGYHPETHKIGKEEKDQYVRRSIWLFFS